jgi:hypothetical protein
MDRQQIEACLAKVTAFRASGQTAADWCDASGVNLRELAGWSAHAGRWRARLDGVSAGVAAAPKPSGFVAARVAPSAAATSVRVELTAGAARLELHWPVAHTRELAVLLRELGR